MGSAAKTCCPPVAGLEFVGRLSDAAGQPFEGVEFWIIAPDPFDLSGRSAADGSFRLRYDGAPPSPRIRIREADGRCPVVLHTRLPSGIKCQASVQLDIPLDAQPGEVAVHTMALNCW